LYPSIIQEISKIFQFSSNKKLFASRKIFPKFAKNPDLSGGSA